MAFPRGYRFRTNPFLCETHEKGFIMNEPSWFDRDYYLNQKLLQLQRVMPDEYSTPEQVEAAIEGHGLTLYEHYSLYGRNEGLNPNAYFNETEYLEAKLTSLQQNDQTKEVWLQHNISVLASALAEAGMTPAEHYARYGFQETMVDPNGNTILLNPSNAFDANAYFAAKLLDLQTNPVQPNSWDSKSVADVFSVFQQDGLSPITHYMLYGAAENKVFGIDTVQPVPDCQRMPHDENRSWLGTIVPSNNVLGSVGPDDAVASRLPAPGDMGGLNGKEPLEPAATPSPLPGDSDYVPPYDAEDTTAPTLTSVELSADGKSLLLTFSEWVEAASGTLTLTAASGESQIIQSTDAGQVTTNGTVITVTPAEGLFPNTTYTLSIAAQAFRDASHNAFAGTDATNPTELVTPPLGQASVEAGVLSVLFGSATNTVYTVDKNAFTTICDDGGNDTLYINYTQNDLNHDPALISYIIDDTHFCMGNFAEGKGIFLPFFKTSGTIETIRLQDDVVRFDNFLNQHRESIIHVSSNNRLDIRFGTNNNNTYELSPDKMTFINDTGGSDILQIPFTLAEIQGTSAGEGVEAVEGFKDKYIIDGKHLFIGDISAQGKGFFLADYLGAGTMENIYCKSASSATSLSEENYISITIDDIGTGATALTGHEFIALMAEQGAGMVQVVGVTAEASVQVA